MNDVLDIFKSKYHSTHLDISNCNIPLLVSYENNMENTENSLLFKKTLETNNWEYMFIGEGTKWSGFKDKIINYYICLQNLPEEKIVVFSDSRDVFCLRSPLTFVEYIKSIINSNKIIVSAEMFLIGHMDWPENEIEKCLSKDENFFWQGVPLNKYWTYYNKLDNLPLRKYVNSGLIIGKVKDLCNVLKWIIDQNYTDDQLGIANYLNTFPELVELDYNASILHTSTYGVNGGLYDIERQKHDAPTFSELFGMSAFFLHIPGLNGSKGQKYLYETIKKMTELEIIKLNNEIYNLYGVKEKSDFNYYIKNI
jgi:hypothetical protein